MTLHLLIPFKNPIPVKDFANLERDLQKVCDKYGMGKIYVYLGNEVFDDD